MYQEEPGLLQREVMPPRTPHGIFGPLAAMATVMLMTVASVAIVTVPPPTHARVRRAQTWIEPAPYSGPYIRPAQDICRGPVYRPGPEGRTEMLYEVCAAAPIPRIIHHD